MGLEMKVIRGTMPQTGSVHWIGLRPERAAEIHVVESVQADAQGLVGDFFQGPEKATRQVTLIQQEHIEVMANVLGRDRIDPRLLRRNIVVSGINLKALKKCDFQIGGAVLFGTGNCAPCSLMEKNLGPGGYNAMRGHGGITAYVVSHGAIKIGDEVKVELPPKPYTKLDRV